MADLIKTWPAIFDRRKVNAIFRSEWAMFYFTLGRGKPKQEVEYLWFTHQGEILGKFKVQEIVCNVGQLPKLRSLEDRESEWQIKRDRWVAICPGPFAPIDSEEPVFMDSFRGWHYFNFSSYVEQAESKIPI